MSPELQILQAIRLSPTDDLAWLALADCLEEDGETGCATLLRLTRQLRGVAWEAAERPHLEAQVCALLAGGVRPRLPTRVNAIGMELVLVPPGVFLMGSPESEIGRDPREGLPRTIEVPAPFEVGVAPVTQQQYAAVMGRNPSYFSDRGQGKEMVAGRDTSWHPVECVSWDEAFTFCEMLSRIPLERELGCVYRLPTEVEWEYVCRAGSTSTTTFHCGATLSATQANCDGLHPYGGPDGPCLERTSPVGSYPPNAWGLVDLHGNVWEWCRDLYQMPEAEDLQDLRIARGGCWFNVGAGCRAAQRGLAAPGSRLSSIGFRVVCQVANCAKG